MPDFRPSPVSWDEPDALERPVVVCVDDDRAVLSSLRRLLRGEPYELVTTVSPAQALASLRRRPVAVVISDERMPETSGSELLAEVRARWPWVGRVILTAYPGHDIMTRGLEAGVDFLLFKPWDAESLKRTVHRMFRDAERERARREASSVGDGEHDLGGEGG
jgi:response regulator RpfG family c-di-GMP phosphodiesterase